MKTITTNVYEFDELSDKAKEKARDWYKEGDDFDSLSDDMTEALSTLLKKNKIKCDKPDIQYSLGYCQGDGAMFAGVCEWKKYTIKVTQSGHYYHYNSKQFAITLTKTGEEPVNYAEVEEKFNTVYVKMCRELESVGYKYIEYQRSNESVDENIRANEYTFTESGKRFG